MNAGHTRPQLFAALGAVGGFAVDIGPAVLFVGVADKERIIFFRRVSMIVGKAAPLPAGRILYYASG